MPVQKLPICASYMLKRRKKKLCIVFLFPLKNVCRTLYLYSFRYYTIAAVCAAAGNSCCYSASSSIKIFWISFSSISAREYMWKIWYICVCIISCPSIRYPLVSSDRRASTSLPSSLRLLWLRALHLYESVELNACIRCNTVLASIRWRFVFIAFVCAYGLGII